MNNYECYGHMNLFDLMMDSQPKSVYEIIDSILEDDLLRGTMFSGGKKRVYALYQSNKATTDRVEAIREEYGIGGHSLSGEHYRHGFIDYNARKITITYDNDKKIYPWSEVEKIIHRLVDSGKYYHPQNESEVMQYDKR